MVVIDISLTYKNSLIQAKPVKVDVRVRCCGARACHGAKDCRNEARH